MHRVGLLVPLAAALGCPGATTGDDDTATTATSPSSPGASASTSGEGSSDADGSTATPTTVTASSTDGSTGDADGGSPGTDGAEEPAFPCDFDCQEYGSRCWCVTYSTSGRGCADAPPPVDVCAPHGCCYVEQKAYATNCWCIESEACAQEVEAMCQGTCTIVPACPPA